MLNYYSCLICYCDSFFMSVNLDELVVLIYKFMKHVEPTRISVN